MRITREGEMGNEPTRPTGSRRARVALLLAGVVVLLAGAGAALSASGSHDRQPDGPAGAAAAGATVAGQGTPA
jgi:hypothetical protein